MAQPRVLRLCSVFEPGADMADWRFDPVGGMQTHTGALTRQLNRQGVAQDVITSRLARRHGVERIGDHARGARVGIRMRWLRQLWALAAIGRVLVRRASYDLVHAHQGEDLILLPLGWLAAWWHRCPWVMTAHCPSLYVSSRGAPTAADQGLRRVAGASTPTAGACGHHAHRRGGRSSGSRRRKRYGPARDPIRRGGQRLPAATSRPLRGHRLSPSRLHRPAGTTKVGPHPGRRLARLRHPEAQLVIVEDGPDRAALEALAHATPRRSGHGHRFPGAGSDPRVLRHTDVLVLPSRYEELGSVLLEGLAAGVPIVASRVGGVPSVISHGHSGLLVPPDAAAPARCLDDVLGRPALAARLADGARGQADRYDWEQLADEVLEVYRTAADRRARRPRMRPVTA